MTGKKKHKSRYQTFLVLSYFTGFLYFVPNILSRSVDKGNVSCGISVDLQKPSDNVEHDIFLAKLEHYGIRGIGNEWLKLTSLTKNNLFLLMVMFLIKPL